MYLGIRAASSSIVLIFTTHAATGANVAPSSAFEAADIRIYKDGSDTQRSSSNGITMTSPFDSLTGVHQVVIDLSDNTDAGFYAAGSRYVVVLAPDETVDSLAVTKVLAHFDIGVAPANVTQIAGSTVSTSSAQLGVNVVNAAGTAWGSGAITAGVIAADAIGASELATDAVNEIRDAIAALAMVEPTAVPAVTGTLKETLSWILALSRNKITQTSSTQTLRNDADSGDIATSAHSSDGTTFTRDEWA